jgi:hypothetical protein
MSFNAIKQQETSSTGYLTYDPVPERPAHYTFAKENQQHEH